MRTETFRIETGGRRVHDVTERVAAFARRRRRRRAAPRVRAARDRRRRADGDRQRLGDRPRGAARAVLPRDDRYAHRHGIVGHGGDHLLPVFVSPSLVAAGRRRRDAAGHLAVGRAGRPEPRERRADGAAQLRARAEAAALQVLAGRALLARWRDETACTSRSRSSTRSSPSSSTSRPDDGRNSTRSPPSPRGRRGRRARRRPTPGAWEPAPRSPGSAGRPRSCARRSRGCARPAGRP